MNKRKVGDYNWRQLSMWDCAPSNSIETFVKSKCKNHVFHYYLTRVTDIISKDQCKNEIVTDLIGVPDSVLSWQDGEIKKVNND